MPQEIADAKINAQSWFSHDRAKYSLTLVLHLNPTEKMQCLFNSDNSERNQISLNNATQTTLCRLAEQDTLACHANRDGFALSITIPIPGVLPSREATIEKYQQVKSALIAMLPDDINILRANQQSAPISTTENIDNDTSSAHAYLDITVSDTTASRTNSGSSALFSTTNSEQDNTNSQRNKPFQHPQTTPFGTPRGQ